MAYFSLAELGGAFRSVHGWLHVALIRRDEVKQVVGGMACVLASIAEFVQQKMHTCSVYLAASSTGPATVDVRLRTVFLVADEDGLRAGLAVKGSSGLKPCFRCQNCVALQHSSLAGFFAIDHANFSDFQPHTNGSLEETLACLRRVQDRPALLAEAELLAGWYLRDDTLLGRADLCNFIPVQHCFFDPMHCYYSCGLIACEAGLFLAKCRELIGLRQEHIDRLGATGFQQPQQQGRPKQVLHASTSTEAHESGLQRQCRPVQTTAASARIPSLRRPGTRRGKRDTKLVGSASLLPTAGGIKMPTVRITSAGAGSMASATPGVLCRST